MEHVKDIELIELAAGNLSLVRAEQVESHLLKCAECMDRSREFGETWEGLGDWQVDAGERDITLNVMAAVKVRRGRGVTVAVLRIAATIVIAAGLGHAAGKVSMGTPEEVQGEHYIAALGLEYSNGLTWAAISENTDGEALE